MIFAGQNVLVTGASRGIGRSIAQQFAAQGACVAVHYRSNRAAADETLDSLAGSGHLLVSAEMGDPADVQQLISTVVAAMGRIHILVNNAGIYIDHPLPTTDYAAWQAAWSRVLAVNLTGIANAMWCAGQHMIAQGGGRIVNISSRGAFRGEPTAPAYGASKAGLNAMSQSLAKLLAPHNIFVGVVAPGFVETEMAADHLAGEAGAAIRAQSPLNRVATPDEVARAAIFLASPGTEFMTGAIIDVNGASYLRT
jgi:NAD(P)-dependent dehydrogenase (short-subunit alcohol dehydrogenase family)